MSSDHISQCSGMKGSLKRAVSIGLVSDGTFHVPTLL